MAGEMKYEDYKENEFVESMGGRDLMASRNENISEPAYDPAYLDTVAEQRRVAAMETARGLGFTSAKDLIQAAKEIEQYLHKGDGNDANATA